MWKAKGDINGIEERNGKKKIKLPKIIIIRCVGDQYKCFIKK